MTFSLPKHSLRVSVLSSHDAGTRSQFPGSEVPPAEAGLPASRGPLQGPPVPCDGPVALLQEGAPAGPDLEEAEGEVPAGRRRGDQRDVSKSGLSAIIKALSITGER